VDNGRVREVANSTNDDQVVHRKTRGVSLAKPRVAANIAAVARARLKRERDHRQSSTRAKRETKSEGRRFLGDVSIVGTTMRAPRCRATDRIAELDTTPGYRLYEHAR